MLTYSPHSARDAPSARDALNAHPASDLAIVGVRLLDPLRFPLQGSRLIEASAGTGKTFTIATLYVRLVLGHGSPQGNTPGEIQEATDDAALVKIQRDRLGDSRIDSDGDSQMDAWGNTQGDFQEKTPDDGQGDDQEDAAGASQGHSPARIRAYTPPEILVVTFTEAATQELRDRIRARLNEAADCFRADPASIAPKSAGEDLLHDLRQDYPPGQWPGCAYRLQLAAEWMDEAAVSTIHAWCHRMLREHAFDSGNLFHQTLETDQSDLLAEVVRDYWRTFMLPLDLEDVAEVRRWWVDPETLRQALKGLVDHAELLDDTPAPAQSLDEARQEKRRRLAALKAPWASWTEELQALLDGAVASKSVDGRKLQARYYQPWLEALRAWVADPAAAVLDLKTGWERLSPAGLAAVWKPERGPVPIHPALAATADLRTALSSLPDAREAILRHATRWVAARFVTEQARRAQMGFNDLLTRLDAALRGPNGARLADTIRRQFPVALIDEFQDTDPVQYRIFDAVYQVASNDPATALVLIGDPKQAIYAFRGADIYTYLKARQACAGRLYTLGTNYRSTHAMVRAANRCFTVAEERATGAGAFLFRGEKGNPLPFIPAEARGRDEALSADGQEVPALTTWWLPPLEEGKPLTKEAYRDQIAEACASEMVRLLNLGQAGRAGFVSGGTQKGIGAQSGAAQDAAAGASAAPLKPLRPADLAVLVNKRKEADLIRRALARRGVRSVYLSDQDSVYQSPQAHELQLWLAACAEPDDSRLVRSALATRTLGLSWWELDQLNQDDLALEERVMQFRGYRDRWRRQGVLPMLRTLLNEFRVPARLLGAGLEGDATTGPLATAIGGERVLTDLLHLAELLQQASLVLDGEHALIRYLAEQCQEAGGGGRDDARQIRLESDADLVRVVTVHKSKGLEYPLVFLPFAADFRPTAAKDLPLKWHDDQGELQLSLREEDEALERADHERLGEDLRKLYVALTRARYATWVGLAPIAGLERGAFGYLLSGGEPLPRMELDAALVRLRGDCADLALTLAPSPSAMRFRAPDRGALMGGARDSRQVVTEPWWIASYSTISRTLSRSVLGAAETRATAGEVAEAETDAALAASRPPGEAAGTASEERFLEMQALGARLPAAGLGPDVGPNANPIFAAFQGTAPTPVGRQAVGPGVSPDAWPQVGSDAWPAGVAPLARVEGRHPGAGPRPPGGETPIPDSPHAFPRGPEAGSFLHELLEWAAREGFGAIAAAPARLRDTIAHRCQLRGWEAWIEPLTAWLLMILTQPLPLPSPLATAQSRPGREPGPVGGPSAKSEPMPVAGRRAGATASLLAATLSPPLALEGWPSDSPGDSPGDSSEGSPGDSPGDLPEGETRLPESRSGPRLADLTTAVPELEFWLATQRVEVGTLDRLVSAATLEGAPRPPLQPARLHGMLKGFMDLVFEHQGCYYVADYKSNWLGPDASAYTPAALQGAILHARYELQYVLYLLALHRLLKSRLPDYDYDRHVGGAAYLFLRGIDGPCQGLHWERPPRELIETLDDLFSGTRRTDR